MMGDPNANPMLPEGQGDVTAQGPPQGPSPQPLQGPVPSAGNQPPWQGGSPFAAGSPVPQGAPPGLWWAAQRNPQLGDILQRIMAHYTGQGAGVGLAQGQGPGPGFTQGQGQDQPPMMQPQPLPMPTIPPQSSQGQPGGFSGQWFPMVGNYQRLAQQFQQSPYAPQMSFPPIAY